MASPTAAAAVPPPARFPPPSSQDIIWPPPVSSADQAKYEALTEEDKHNCSYQYHGYSAFAQWMASSNDFFILRRFAPLNARCLLFLQNEIAKREKAIEAWDDYVRRQPYGKGASNNLRTDRPDERIKLVKQLIPLLQQYNDLVNSFSRIKAIPTAGEHHIRNLTNWMTSYPDAIISDEQHFKGKEGDLFPIVSKPKSPLREFMEQSRLLRFRFKVSKRSDRIDSKATRYYSDKAFEYFVSVVILVIGLCMLFAPMWWLNFVTRNDYRLAIITWFVTIFTFWAWLAAGQRPFEILASVAAYAAVLMIYRQIQ